MIQKMIVWHRKKSKMSQSMLADLSGISRTAIQRIEKGHAPVQTDTLLKVLETLNITLAFKSPLMEKYKEQYEIDCEEHDANA